VHGTGEQINSEFAPVGACACCLGHCFFNSRGLRTPEYVTKRPIGMETDTYLDTTTSRPSESSDGGNELDAQFFRRLRKSRKLSQQWVASKCGCSVSLIYKWEKGAYSPSGEIMRRIECTASEIEALPICDLKHCWKCKTQKHLSLFGRDNSRPNGYQSKCLACNYEIVQTWRKANKTRFNDRKRVKYKIKTSGSRQAGHKWVNGDKRSLQEIQLIGTRDELSIRKRQFRCSPKKTNEERKMTYLITEANRLLGVKGESDEHENSLVDSFYETQALEIKQQLKSGQITETEAREMAYQITQ
jgi:transcriptional regulator with XRE-family HTH domain